MELVYCNRFALSVNSQTERASHSSLIVRTARMEPMALKLELLQHTNALLVQQDTSAMPSVTQLAMVN